MKLQRVAWSIVVGSLALSAPVWGDGSAEEGQAKSAQCVACHGVNGNSSNPQWPNLAGQSPWYVVKQLKAFKAGDRTDPLMSPMAAPLSDDDMEDLAEYFANQPLTGLEADASKVAEGQRLYRGGDPVAGIPACTACHGPTGMGVAAASFPAIKGQHATYTATQLKAYRAGTRKTDQTQNQMMRNVANRLTDSQIEAVSAYVQGLR